MSCKVLDIRELEKSFQKSTEVVGVPEQVAVLAPKKRIKIRECGDLRYWWDDNTVPACDQLGNAG
jgi:hypothetical protein